MNSAHKLAQRFGKGGIKTSFVRIGDDPSIASTTDVFIGSGTGAPSGAYNLVSGATALYLREDASTATTGVYVSVDGGTTWYTAGPGAGIPLAAQQNLSGPGAVNVTSYYTAITTTGADAFTLADGTAYGQLKKIQMVVDGGDGTLTPSNLASGTTITFADAGDYAVLGWNGAEWVALELGNAADGATAPVLA